MPRSWHMAAMLQSFYLWIISKAGWIFNLLLGPSENSFDRQKIRHLSAYHIHEPGSSDTLHSRSINCPFFLCFGQQSNIDMRQAFVSIVLFGSNDRLKWDSALASYGSVSYSNPVQDRPTYRYQILPKHKHTMHPSHWIWKVFRFLQ